MRGVADVAHDRRRAAQWPTRVRLRSGRANSWRGAARNVLPQTKGLLIMHFVCRPADLDSSDGGVERRKGQPCLSPKKRLSIWA